MSETHNPFGSSHGDVLPPPTPEAQELLDVLSRAAAGQGSKELHHQFTAPVNNEHGVPIMQSASVRQARTGSSGQYRSIAEASVLNSHPDVTHGSVHIDVVNGQTQTETNLQFDPRTGKFSEYTTSRNDPFATPTVRTNTMREGMSARRTQAAARLARLKFGIERSADSNPSDTTDHATGQE